MKQHYQNRLYCAAVGLPSVALHAALRSLHRALRSATDCLPSDAAADLYSRIDKPPGGV